MYHTLFSLCLNLSNQLVPLWMYDPDCLALIQSLPTPESPQMRIATPTTTQDPGTYRYTLDVPHG